MEHVRGDDELLQDILAGVEAASWACAILFSLWVVGLGRKPTECAETGLPKKLREGLHGQWFEIAGTHGFPGRGLRSALRRDPSRYSLSFQFTNTGTDVMDAVMTTTDCPEDGGAYRNSFVQVRGARSDVLRVHMLILPGAQSSSFPSKLLHLSEDNDLLLLGSPSDKHVIHVLSKESKPSRDKLIRCMQVVLGLGFSLQDLGPLSNCQYVSQKSAFSTVRRYGILTSRETKFNSEAGFNMSYNYARGRRGARQTEQSTAERTDQSPGWSAQKESGNPVSPEIFRDQVDNDLEYRTFAKFFDGCVRGEQRFVADFIDREPLWTLARHKRTLWTGLHFAAYNGYSELVSYFLGKGSNPCARSARGESPLAVALTGMLRHIGERMRWDDGSSCVFDLREGDETYSHKPHSLERYEETVRKLLWHSPCLSTQCDNLGEDPLRLLLAGWARLEESALAAHPRVAGYARRYLQRVQQRILRASYLPSAFIPLDSNLRRSGALLSWALARACGKVLHFAHRILDTITLVCTILCLGAFYWGVFRPIGLLLIYSRVWVSFESRQMAANAFKGDCAVLFILSLDSPIVSKFGQLISGRIDLISQAVASRLSIMQSHGISMSPREVRSTLNMNYGEDYSHIFEAFDLRPFAVGTVAQVHRARLASNGELVAVKIIKRGMEEGLERYLRLLHALSWLGFFGRTKAARLRIEHLAMMFLQQTDLNLEAASKHAMQREAWGHIKRDGNNLHTPEFPIVHSQFSMHHVLVMDMMEGCVPLLEYLAKPTFPIKLILTRLGRIHLRNEFMDGLVHCDLHPGNIMIRPDNGRIVLLDFGLVGELTESDRVGTTLAMLAGITSHADVSVDVFLTNYIQDSEFVFADPDLRARFVVAMLPLFRTHMSTSGSWDFAEFSADYTRVLTDFDLGLTSCWYTLEMSVIHIVSTLALLQPEAAFKDAVWQLLHAEHEALLNNIAGSEYYDRLEGPLRRKFEWAKIFQRNS